MVSAVKWEAAPSGTDILTTALNSLANNTISAASTTIANRTGLNTYFVFELEVTYGTAPSDTNPTVDLGISISMDGTNFTDAPLTGFANQQLGYLISIPVQKVTTAQRIATPPLLLPPASIRIYADNQTGQAMAASANVLAYYPVNFEGQ